MGVRIRDSGGSILNMSSMQGGFINSGFLSRLPCSKDDIFFRGPFWGPSFLKATTCLDREKLSWPEDMSYCQYSSNQERDH